MPNQLRDALLFALTLTCLIVPARAAEKVGPEFKVNTSAVTGQLDPKVASLQDGGFVVVWSTGVHGAPVEPIVLCQRYSSDGSPLGNEFRTPGSFWGSDQPTAAGLSGGGFVIVWRSGVQRPEVGSQTYSFDGTPLIWANQGLSQLPAVAAFPDGGFVAAWQQSAQPKHPPPPYEIRSRRFASDGAYVGSWFRVNTIDVGSSFAPPSVAALADGSFVVVWTVNDDDIKGQRYREDGRALGGEFLINTHTGSTQRRPVVAALGDGGFVVTWESFAQDGSGFGVYGQRYRRNGTPFGAEFRANTYTILHQERPSVTGLKDGGFVVTWQSLEQDGSGYGIYGQRYRPSGRVLGREFRVNTRRANNQITPSVAALADDGFVVTWAGADGVYGQRFSAAP